MKRIENNIVITYGENITITYTPELTRAKEVKINEAIMILETTILNNQKEYQVKYGDKLIDIIKDIGENGCISLDITKILNEAFNEELTSLQINVIANSNDIVFADKKEVYLNYKSIKARNNVIKEEININSKCRVEVNVESGELCLENDTHWGITNNYSSVNANRENIITYCDNQEIVLGKSIGKGWKNNLQQYVIKEAKSGLLSDKESANRYVYVDEEGIENEFLEKYYYLNDDEKIYVDEEEVSIDLFGKLTYQDYEIQKELVTESGLILVSKFESVKGMELISQENKEILEIQEELKQIDLSLEEMKNTKSNNLKALELIELQLEANRINDALEIERKEYDEDDINYTEEILTLRRGCLTALDRYRQEQDLRIYDEETKVEYGFKLTYDTLSDELENKNIDALESTLLYKQGTETLKNQFSDINSLYIEKNASLEEIKILQNIEQVEKLIKDYENKKKIKEHELKILRQQDADIYIICDNTLILGFSLIDSENVYKLILMKDGYNNEVKIEYENDNIIKVTKDNKGINFVYKADVLESIQNANGKKIVYEYENNYLTCIRESNKKYVNFTYDENGLLTNVMTNTGKGYTFEYCDRKVSRVNKVCKEKIKHQLTIEYEGMNRYIKLGNKETFISYTFDIYGNLVCKHSNKFNQEIQNVEISKYHRRSSTKEITIQPYLYKQELLEDIPYQGNELVISESYFGENELGEIDLVSLAQDDDHTIFTVNRESPTLVKILSEEEIIARLSNKKQLVISGWAKADSGQIISRMNGNVSNIFDEDEISKKHFSSCGNFIKERRFELRCELTYEDAENNPKEEYYISYDHLNCDWQSVVLPVTLKDTLPSEIKIIFDYTNNVGDALFTRLSMNEGFYEYSEFNDAGKLVYYKNSLDDKEVFGEYKDNLLVKETLKKNDKNYDTLYSYDSSGRLIQLELYNGLVSEYVYNDQSEVVKEYTYYKKDPSLRIYNSETPINEKGTLDVLLNEYGEDITSDAIYTDYDDNGNPVALRNGDQANISEYDEDENLIKVSHNDFSYEYSYDEFSRLINCSISGSSFVSTSYSDDDKVITNQYVNGESYVSECDDNGNLLRVKYLKDNEVIVLVENVYNRHNDLIYTTDCNNITHEYSYDKFGNREKEVCHINNHILEFDYLGDNQKIDKEIVKFNDITKEKEFSYNEHNQLVSIKLEDGNIEHLHYDNLTRLKEIEIDNKYNKRFEYMINNDHTGELISEEKIYFGESMNERYSYDYDNQGNIIRVKRNSEEIIRYEYDKSLRLIREDNKLLNKSVCIEYDLGGNIIAKTESEYTKEEVNGNRVLYAYSYSGNRDRLVSYDEKSIVYDSMGLPIIYKDIPLQWNRNNLIEYGSNTYNYNGSGLRISKTVANVTTHYYYQDDKLRFEDNGNLIYYQYDLNGVIGFTYDNVGTYYYKKNIQGDILSILDENNIEIVKYVYDAYGNHKTYVLDDNAYIDISVTTVSSISGANNKLIAEMNPFRYRGYYYDRETNLYYLITRYYDPQTGRFISPDSINNLNTEVINGLNLYAYGLNNPVMYVDALGTKGIKWYDILAGIGLVVLLAATVVACVYIFKGGVLTVKGATILGGLFGGALVGIAGGVVGFVGASIYDYAVGNEFGTNSWKWAKIGIGFGTLIGIPLGAHWGSKMDIPKEITLISSHGIDQMNGRDGGLGVKEKALRDAFENPIEIERQMVNGQRRYKFKGKNGEVVLNSKGHVITGWSKNKGNVAHPENFKKFSNKKIITWFFLKLGLDSMFASKE